MLVVALAKLFVLLRTSGVCSISSIISLVQVTCLGCTFINGGHQEYACHASRLFDNMLAGCTAVLLHWVINLCSIMQGELLGHLGRVFAALNPSERSTMLFALATA